MYVEARAPVIRPVLHDIDIGFKSRYLGYEEIFLVVASEETRPSGFYNLTILVGEKLYQLNYADMSFSRYVEIV